MNEQERINRRFEKKYYPKVQKVLKGQISSLIRAIQYNGNLEDGMRELQKGITSPVAEVIQDIYLEVGLQYARKQWRKLQQQKREARKSRNRVIEVKGFGFNQAWVNFIKDFLFRFLTEVILFQVAETTRNTLILVLQKAINEGWGIDETVRELDELPLSRTQAARIVRTEITRAANTGTMAGASTFEYEQQKEWIAAHDSRTRGQHIEDHASHIDLDGQVIDYDDVFTDPRNGDKLRYPGDPGGNGLPPTSAASTINCRCSIAVVAKFDRQGRLIPKRKTTVVIYPKR